MLKEHKEFQAFDQPETGKKCECITNNHAELFIINNIIAHIQDQTADVKLEITEQEDTSLGEYIHVYTSVIMIISFYIYSQESPRTTSY